MKMLFFSVDGSEVALVNRELTHAGIRCQVRNGPAHKDSFQTHCSAELWVQNDQDYQKAATLCLRLEVGFDTRQIRRSARLWTNVDDLMLRQSCSPAN